MTLIAATFALFTVAMYVTTCFWRNRSRNLEIHGCELRDQLANAYAALDDATRNEAYWQERTDVLVKENNTLVVDLWRTETEAQYLRGFVRRQKDTTAGVVLLYGTPNPKRQLYVATAEAMP